MSEIDPSHIAAVVVTYQPDLTQLEESLTAMAPQVNPVVVVDNGSDDLAGLESLCGRYPRVRLVPLGENLGIATALNRGVSEVTATHDDVSWIFTFDQDSKIADRAVAEVSAAFAELEPPIRSRCGIVALKTGSDEEPGHVRTRMWSKAMSSVDLGRVGRFTRLRLAISSGNLVRREVFEFVSFREPFFIDQVDNAFCADIAREGWTILQTPRPLLSHHLGEKFAYKGGERTYENAQRLYYVSRNSVVLLVRGDIPPVLFLVQLVALMRSYAFRHGTMGAVRCGVIVSVGIFDALAGRMGRREYGFIQRHL